MKNSLCVEDLDDQVQTGDNALVLCFVQFTYSKCAIKAALFDRVAEQLLGKNREEIYALNTEETEELLARTENRLPPAKFRAEIRAVRKNYDDKVPSYSIQQLIPKTMATGEGSSEESGSLSDKETATQETQDRKKKAIAFTDPATDDTASPTTPAKKPKNRSS